MFVFYELWKKYPVNSKKCESRAIEKSGLKMQVRIEVVPESTAVSNNSWNKIVE